MKKILIVGTVPYNPNFTSRAFKTYFDKWDKSKLAQVYSNKNKPLLSFYHTLYQITDEQLLKRTFNKKNETGIIYNKNDAEINACIGNSSTLKNKLIDTLYKIGTNKSPLMYLLRGLLWKKKFWNTKKFNDWLVDFSPDIVFLAFSDDFFIINIARYVADKFKIPIIASIGDDYYFNKRFSISPFYYIYRFFYKRIIRLTLKTNASSIYIGDKIMKKYNTYFNLRGKTIYLTSDLSRRDFKPINLEDPFITYFGNIRLGRNESIIDISKSLEKINPSYIIHVYSNEKVKRYFANFKKRKNIKFMGSINYEEVKKLSLHSDLLLVVEGFKKKDVNVSRYSLSTKVADALTSGSNIFAYGSIECGAIEYLKSTDSVCVCDNKKSLFEILNRFFNNKEEQYKYYNNSLVTLNENHSIDKNSSILNSIVGELSNDES